MRSLINVALILLGIIFGGSTGAVLGLLACLVLRDGLQLEMPLSRITIIAGVGAACGAIVSVVLDVRRFKAEATAPAADNAKAGKER